LWSVLSAGISLVVFLVKFLVAVEQTTPAFRAENGKPYSVFKEVNIVQSNEPNSIVCFWTSWQRSAAVGHYWRETSDAYYLIRLPKLFKNKSGQSPTDLQRYYSNTIF
jgi:hypothetical protein